MATRTIAVGGGNWNSTGTWVEGVVPTSADDVVALAGGLSGQLTVPAVSCIARSIDFTNYTNTFTYTAAGTLTISGGIVFVSGMTLSGSTARTITIANAATGTLTSGGQTIPWSLTISQNAVITMGDNWTLSGNLTLTAGCTISSNTINIAGGLTGSATGTAVGGSTNLVMNGTGTWQQTSTGELQSNLTFNTAGTITISGTVYLGNGKTLTYTAGTIVTTGSTLKNNSSAGITLNTNGMTWNSMQFLVSATITINSLLSGTGTLSVLPGVAITFAGTSGFTYSNLAFNSAVSVNLIFKNGLTYRVTSSLTANLANQDTHSVFKTDSAGVTATLILSYGATCNVGYIDMTDLVCSGGRTIWNFGGVLSNTTNVLNFTQPNTVAAASGAY